MTNQNSYDKRPELALNSAAPEPQLFCDYAGTHLIHIGHYRLRTPMLNRRMFARKSSSISARWQTASVALKCLQFSMRNFTNSDGL